jgi:hypothetical protein
MSVVSFPISDRMTGFSRNGTILAGDFFGFFGAQKKGGLFWGRHQKSPAQQQFPHPPHKLVKTLFVI